MKQLILFLLIGLTNLTLSYAQQCIPNDFATMNANNVNTTFSNGEVFFWDLNDGQYEVPQGGDTHSIFAGSIWMGGIDEDGVLKAAAGTYRQTGNDFFSGPLNENGETEGTWCDDFNRVFSIEKTEVEDLIANNFEASFITENIKNWPARNNPNFDLFDLPADMDLAPFVDANNDGSYNPADGDYPLCKGDQNFWCVFNDAIDEHTETGAQSLGFQIEGYYYALASNDALNNTTFWEFDLTNKSDKTINDFYFTFWLDIDLGNYLDDFVGCSPEKNIAYAYNGDDYDDGTVGYGDNIPVIGVEIIKGLKNDEGEDLGLSTFLTYNNDFTVNGSPETATHFYNYMKGIWKDGSEIIDPNTNEVTTYMYNNSPSDANGWSECSLDNQASDRRFLLASGPATIESGEKQKLTYAIYWVEENIEYPCPDAENVFNEASFLANVYLNQFEDEPNVATTGIDESIIKIGPNPASTFCEINVGKHQKFDVEITSLSGKTVYTATGLNEIGSVDLTNFSNGQYLLSISQNQQLIATQKLVVVK